MKWKLYRSKHYIFHYFENSLAEKEIESIAKNQETCYKQIADFLDIRSDITITYYFYPDRKIKDDLTGNDGNGHTVWKKHQIHALYNNNVKCIGSHEDTHILSLPYGRSVKLFREGMAEYLSKKWHGKLHDYWVKTFYQKKNLPVLEKIVDDRLWDEIDDMITYPIAGSFTKYLINKIGKEKYLKLYKKINSINNPELNKKIIHMLTGQKLTDLQEDWIKKVVNTKIV